MEKLYKVIVAHPGKQHSFRLASALKKDLDFEVTYITTVYDKSNSILMKLINKLVSNSNRKRAKTRRNKDFLDEEVVQFCQIGGLIEIYLSRFDKSGKLYSAWHKKNSAKFGIKVAKYAIKHKFDAVICYDTNAFECFKYLEKYKPEIHRILDASAVNAVFMKKIYENDMYQNPLFKNKLKKEVGKFLTNQHQIYTVQETKSTEYVLAASQFVENSYTSIGFDKNKIKICPYGVDLKSFSYKRRKMKNENEVINFVFVGGTKQLKGISYLMDAFMKLPPEKALLTVVGNVNLSEELITHYKKKIKFTGTLLHAEVAKVLKKNDVMIFPSLGDGFGLSALEAMACGCPLICTENSGVSDLVTEMKNGFVIPAQEVEGIINRVDWFLNNREILPEMGENAYNTAKEYTWDEYNKKVSKAIKAICVT